MVNPKIPATTNTAERVYFVTCPVILSTVLRTPKRGMVGMEGDLIEGNFKDIFRRGFLSSIKFIL